MFAYARQVQTNDAAAYVLAGFLLIIPLLYFAFWMWMLFDCINYELPGSREKINWTVAILVLGAFGALLYNVTRRKVRKRELGR